MGNPAGSSYELCLGISRRYNLASITPLYNSDSQSTHPNFVKGLPSLFITTWFCRMLFSSAGVHTLPVISLVGEAQLILHVVGNPHCKLGGQPLEGWVVLAVGWVVLVVDKT